MFKQNLKQFISSKTNWASMASIGFGLYGVATQTLSIEVAFAYVEGGLLGIGLRDAI